MGLEARDAGLDDENYALAAVLELGCIAWFRRLVVAPSCSSDGWHGARRVSFAWCSSAVSQLTLTI
jgi:hypothetical protein